jgi:hypothetical protein
VARRGDNLDKVQERPIKLDLGQAGLDVLSIRLQHARVHEMFFTASSSTTTSISNSSQMSRTGGIGHHV